MLKNLISKITNIDKSIVKVIKKILIVSFFICMVSVLILAIYISNPISHVTYLAGLKLFKSGLMIGIFGFICGVGTDFFIKQ